MKKITFLWVSFLTTAIGFSQNTFAIYTEDANIGAGLGGVRFSNGQGYSAPGGSAEVTTDAYEGTTNFLWTYNNSNSYVHGILIGTNGTNDGTGDVASDFSAYTHYNIAIKTVSEAPFFIRMRGNGITAKVRIDPAQPAENVYGFQNDGAWHFLSIPFTAFIPDSGTFSLTTVTEVFVLRSDFSGTLVDGVSDDFEIDNIYVSDSEILSNNQNELSSFKMYPNPAKDSFTINASETIDAVTIFNILGKEVLNIQPNTNAITQNISSLQSGVYLVKVTTAGKTNISKLIKE